LNLYLSHIWLPVSWSSGPARNTMVRNGEDAFYIIYLMKEKETPSRGGLNDVASCGFGLMTKFQWLVAVNKFWCNISLIEYTPSFFCILTIMQFFFLWKEATYYFLV
jgi:hypothetical protein